ncbi:MAG: arylamine N-acetyltransferase family protein [Steroidobacteraceae bacterium]
MSECFDLDGYLRRVGYHGPRTPELTTLRALHARHVRSIPFENLDPLLGRPVLLDLPSLTAKLVHGRRGGYCFEQNLLFKAALEAVGFQVTGLAGRVRWRVPPERPLGPRTHMLLRVELAGRSYLADVGFGAQLLDAPLALEAGLEQRTPVATYRLTEQDGRLGLEVQHESQWQLMYLFGLDPQVQADYEMGSWFTATHPHSWFRHRLFVERLGREARHTLANTSLLERRYDGAVIERRLASPRELAQALERIFDLSPPVAAEALYARIAPLSTRP